MNAEGYEFAIQYREGPDEEWAFYYTNKFDEERPYPSKKSVNNALAQIKSPPKWSYRARVADTREYRIVKRPYGDWEDHNA